MILDEPITILENTSDEKAIQLWRDWNEQAKRNAANALLSKEKDTVDAWTLPRHKKSNSVISSSSESSSSSDNSIKDSQQINTQISTTNIIGSDKDTASTL